MNNVKYVCTKCLREWTPDEGEPGKCPHCGHVYQPQGDGMRYELEMLKAKVEALRKRIEELEGEE